MDTPLIHQLKVLQAANDGKEIEYCYPNDQSPWKPVPKSPTGAHNFDFTRYLYRIKPEPVPELQCGRRVWWMVATRTQVQYVFHSKLQAEAFRDRAKVTTDIWPEVIRVVEEPEPKRKVDIHL